MFARGNVMVTAGFAPLTDANAANARASVAFTRANLALAQVSGPFVAANVSSSRAGGVFSDVIDTFSRAMGALIASGAMPDPIDTTAGL